MARSRTLLIPLSLLGLFLLGTVVVLSSVSYYLAIDPTAYLTETEVPPSAGAVTANSSRALERIPRIIHQTWKSDVLPDRWKAVSKTCTSLMPDYEYMLWTDESSRDFIAKEYPWYLSTFDGYTYNIQRADAIRYFVLYHYGGVYLDLDVGCMRPLDPLLVYPVILPKTIPVGVSNDLMFSAKGHPFMEQTIHNLITFDHNYFLNYPTVMFSTGPMYVSAQYGLYTASHPHRTAAEDVRVLSKPLYGKNASPLEAPHTFFSHHYGSSWHADDAAFITFLGKWGRLLMKIGMVVLVFGSLRMFWSRRKRSSSSSSSRTSGGGIRRRYSHRHNLSESGSGLDLTGLLSTYGRSAASANSARGRHSRGAGSSGMGSSSDESGLTEPGSPILSSVSSPESSHPTSPTLELPGQLSLPLLPVPFDLRGGASGSSSAAHSRPGSPTQSSEILTERITDAFKRAGSWAAASIPIPSYFSRPSSPGGANGSTRRERSDSTRAHIVGRAPIGGVEESEVRTAGRRAPSQRRGGRGAGNDSQSFIALLPAIFTPSTSSTAGASGSGSGSRPGRRSSNAGRHHNSRREKVGDAEALNEAAEAKAREAGFRLPMHAPSSNNSAAPASSPPRSSGLLGVPSGSGVAGSSSAGSSRAPSPTVFYTPRTSLSNSSITAPRDVLGLDAAVIDIDAQRSRSPLLLDPLDGSSDVRTTGVSSAPPPYNLSTRSTSGVAFGYGDNQGMMTP